MSKSDTRSKSDEYPCVPIFNLQTFDVLECTIYHARDPLVLLTARLVVPALTKDAILLTDLF